MMTPVKILLVEDEMIIAMGLKLILLDHGYETVSILSSGEQAVDFAVEVKPDTILMDIKLKGEMDGIEAAVRIRRQTHIPIIFMTGNSHLISDRDFSALKPFWILPKPTPDWKLFETIDRALDKQQ